MSKIVVIDCDTSEILRDENGAVMFFNNDSDADAAAEESGIEEYTVEDLDAIEAPEEGQ